MNQPNKPLPDLVEEGFQEFLRSAHDPDNPVPAEEESVLRTVWYTACLWAVADTGVTPPKGKTPTQEEIRRAERAVKHRKGLIIISVTNFVAQMQKQN